MVVRQQDQKNQIPNIKNKKGQITGIVYIFGHKLFYIKYLYFTLLSLNIMSFIRNYFME